MKKSCNPNDNHQDGQEQSKKLYRSISESARRLDDAHSCAQNVGDLFSPTVQIQRSRFQEYCERLIFSDPILFGRKAEELLWRKCYYDVISTAKKLKRKEYTPKDVCNIETHINAGVGHYHHFISRLQYQFQLDVKDAVDFAIVKVDLKKSSTVPPSPEQLGWAKLSVHRCLIYLGDLNRYKLEIYPNWDPGLSVRCYLKAVNFKPDYGIPHNQLGTLASSQNRTLDAVYHYICCLSCKYTFDGTENNLLRLFDKNSGVLEEYPIENRNSDCIVQLEPTDHIKRLIARFLFLVEIWYFNRKFSDVYVLCHQTNLDLQECLSFSKPIVNDSDGTDVDTIDTDSISVSAYLSDDIVFKIVVICLLCTSKLQKIHSTQLSTITAFTLAVYSQLLQIVTDHIHNNLLPHLPDESILKINGLADTNWKDNKNTHKKICRRRKKRLASEDSDVSEPEDENETNSISDASAVESDDEFALSSSDNESCDENTPKSVNIEKSEKKVDDTEQSSESIESLSNNRSYKELATKVRKMDPNIMLDIIGEEKLLYSIKILSDWFIKDVDIVKSCGKSTRSLLKQIVQLINFLNINFDNGNIKDVKFAIEQLKEYKIFDLSEDTVLKGVNLGVENNMNWDNVHHKYHLSTKEETVARILRMVSFGHSLVNIEETGIIFDTKLQQFLVQELETDEVNGVDLLLGDPVLVPNGSDNLTAGTKMSDNNENLGQLSKMKHMGQLWLAAEVRALENRVKSKTSLSPYLVLDVDSLIQSTAIVKHLVNSKKFIAVIPLAVVSALDDLKREKPEARDAIRWLELQFHHGNRFCRAQRPQEHTSVPFIKYPKKKDKDLYTYIQIIECCHYFVQQQDATNLVTLLIGENTMSNSENREISYMGLAHSAGINVEIITGFYEKWRKNFKGKK
ncbi:hypothetical protein FQA39_LY00691 [Lamprigera yunnana]|nr:hypothetical protein FQA39_LY00691 [Lamprigera yunnana]